MPVPVFVNAYRCAYELRERALRAADAGLFDEAAFWRGTVSAGDADGVVERSRVWGRRDAYDAVRTYGNAAVHKTDFREDPRQHAELMRRLDAELTSFYRMAMGD